MKRTVAFELVSGWFAGAWSFFEYMFIYYIFTYFFVCFVYFCNTRFNYISYGRDMVGCGGFKGLTVLKVSNPTPQMKELLPQSQTTKQPSGEKCILYIFDYIHIFMIIFIYTYICTVNLFVLKPFKIRSFPIKTRVIWVTCIKKDGVCMKRMYMCRKKSWDHKYIPTIWS